MVINSTEFQQKVGYYLKLAEAGTVVTITKSKPSPSQYQLKFIRQETDNKSKEKLRNFFKRIEENKSKFNFYGKDSVKHTREIRK